MRSYPREYLHFVECLLREYPRDMDELRSMEEVIIAICRGSAIPRIDDAKNASTTSMQERIMILKEKNKPYLWLQKKTDAVRGYLKSLTEKERLIMELSYWQNLKVSEIADELNLCERWIKQVRRNILHKLVKKVVPQWTK
jgi:RNA polymerase sigma factor (sigma-70 family)